MNAVRVSFAARLVLACVLLVALPCEVAVAQDSLVTSARDSVSVHLVDVDLRTAVQALGRYLDKPVAIGNVAANGRVTFETPHPVPVSSVPRLLRGLLESQGMELVADSGSAMYRLAPKPEPRQSGAPASGTAPPRATAGTPGGVQLYVIRLRHARASDVAATVNALFGRGAALGEIGGNPQPLSRELQQNQIPPRAPGPATGGVAGASAVRADASLSGAVTIVPDPRANSLLVRASAGDFALIDAAVQQIDIRPLQVLIEVLIAEVQKDHTLDFGVDVTVPQTHARGKGDMTVGGANAGDAGLGDFAMRVMSIGPAAIDATLTAAASRGDATILSRPVLLAANNEQAEINVGSQRPFVQVDRVLPTDNASRDQVVEYKDVGTKLSVVPTISADGYVMLQVLQEINAATAEQQFNAPVISTRSVDTKLLVKDGQTIVLGGLRDHQHETSQSGVPFLSSIPLIGGFFGHASRSTTETELFIFLTPRIIGDDATADSLTAPLKQRMEKIDHD